MNYRSRSTARLLLCMLAVSLLVGVSSIKALANGNEQLGVPNIAIASGSGIATGGTGLVTQPGTINVNVPEDATIKQVLLYWGCRGAGDNTITVDGTPIMGQKIGERQPAGASFRADITNTDLVQPGPNSLAVTGLACGERNTGASVFVIFEGAFTGGANAFSGRATVVDAFVNILGLLQTDVTVVDAGPIGPGPGSDSETAANANVAGLLTSGTASASTSASGNLSESEATLEDLALNLGTLSTTATLVKSEASATCTSTGPAVAGNADIDNLKILGQSVNLIPNTPNLVVLDQSILGLGQVKIVANEQIVSGAGNTREITVNALHITIKVSGNTVGDIIISSAHADITCQTGTPAANNIQVRDGFDFAFSGANVDAGKVTKTVTFNFTAKDFDRVADLRLFVGDTEATRPDQIVVKVFKGTTVVKTISLKDQLNSDDGAQWDDDQISVPVPSGATKITVRLFSKDVAGGVSGMPDSMVWVLAAINLPTQQDVIVFSGRATVLRASVLNVANVTLVDTGNLPPTGGTLEETLANLGVPLLTLTSQTATARTQGGGNQSNSVARVENLAITDLLDIALSATVIQANAEAECDNGDAQVSGGSTIANLNINGNPINITGNPNQTINLSPLIKIIINEQIKSDTGSVAAITVNALHIIVLNGLPGDLGGSLADVVISSAHADIACP